jgi:ParB-like chromosome segregation protein Spo0J
MTRPSKKGAADGLQGQGRQEGEEAVAAPVLEVGPERINGALAPLVVDIAMLRADPDNARQHPERNITAICSSLERFGQQKPVVAMRDGRVKAGSGLLTAALGLGWKRLAAVVFDSDDEAEAAAFALVDNRTAELATWDFTVLDTTLGALGAAFDLPKFGFAPGEWQVPAANLDALASFAARVTSEHDGAAVTFTFETQEEATPVLEAMKLRGKSEVQAHLVEMCRKLTEAL